MDDVPDPAPAEPPAAMPDTGLGLVPGARVALAAPGGIAYVELVLSLLAGGIFPVPLDPRLTPAERAGILGDLRPALVLERAEEVAALLATMPPGLRRGLPRGRPMHVTSGTTGRPKGVDSGLLRIPDAEALVAEERTLWGFRAEDVNLVLSPLHHSAPLRFAMGTLLAGGRVVLPEGQGPDAGRGVHSGSAANLHSGSAANLHSGSAANLHSGFDAAAVTAAIHRHRPTTMFCVPAHLQRLFAHWERVGVPDLSCFRLVAHAGAPCPDHLKHRLIELFPAGSTWEFYGSTEGQFTACRSEEWLERPGTVGRARPGRRMYVDTDGRLWCRAPSYARFSYVGAPEKTAAAWDADAFTVGDLGRIDAEGYVWLEGRREDLVISGGVNVYPAEVENVLAGLDGVEEIAVFGLPDERWGHRVAAAYVGSVASEVLDAAARDLLSPAKRPKEYHRLGALPRTATGKVRRLDLPALVHRT